MRTYSTSTPTSLAPSTRSVAYRVYANQRQGSTATMVSNVAYGDYRRVPGMHEHRPHGGRHDRRGKRDHADQMTAAMDVSSYFSDADMGDTLTYTAMSDMEMYATADIPADSSMLTITGVAAGMATITVTAMDAAGESATQMIMVTVEAADTTPRAPSGVTATVDDDDPGNIMVTVDFTPGANIPAHGVVLFTSDFNVSTSYIARAIGNSHTFENVASGSYIAVVVALDAAGGLMTDAQGNYLFDPANAITVGN